MKRIGKDLFDQAKHKAHGQFEKLKDKSADILNRVEDKVNEKSQDMKRIGKDLFDQARHKVHVKYESLKDNSMKVLGKWKHSVQEKFKDMTGESFMHSKAPASEDEDTVISEELHSCQNAAAHDGLSDS